MGTGQRDVGGVDSYFRCLRRTPTTGCVDGSERDDVDPPLSSGEVYPGKGFVNASTSHRLRRLSVGPRPTLGPAAPTQGHP